MLELEIKNYTSLNELADQNGIVIFGGSEDRDIPLCELRQAFSIESKLYNRSISNLSITDAAAAYEACVAPLNPETVLLHIGKADLELFKENSSDFDQRYRKLINYIKSANKKCRIAVISLRNYNNSAVISEMNKHLKYIAESERCDFGDIAEKRVWNPKETKDIVSFVYSTGFIHPLRNRRPIFDLIKILFCYEPVPEG